MLDTVLNLSIIVLLVFELFFMVRMRRNYSEMKAEVEFLRLRMVGVEVDTSGLYQLYRADVRPNSRPRTLQEAIRERAHKKDDAPEDRAGNTLASLAGGIAVGAALASMSGPAKEDGPVSIAPTDDCGASSVSCDSGSGF